VDLDQIQWVSDSVSETALEIWIQESKNREVKKFMFSMDGACSTGTVWTFKKKIRTDKKHLKPKTGNVSTGSVTFREGSESADPNN
jgi:hypothetical protein